MVDSVQMTASTLAPCNSFMVMYSSLGRRRTRLALCAFVASCTGSPIEVPSPPNAPTAESWPRANPYNIQIPVLYSFNYPLGPSQYAICLSGGGYRAALFHLGVLWRLNEAGLLYKAARIAGVSGGAITAAVAGANWGKLDFVGGIATNFPQAIVAPVFDLTSHTIDVESVLFGVLTTVSPSHALVHAYNGFLFSHRTLQSLPTEGKGPQVVLLASDMRSGTSWFMSRHAMGSPGISYYAYPDMELAVAVAASSAYPPVLAPLTIDTSGLKLVLFPWTPTELSIADREKVDLWLHGEDTPEKVALASELKQTLPLGFQAAIREWSDKAVKAQNERIGLDDAAKKTIYLEDGGVLSNTGYEMCTTSPRFIVSSAALDSENLTPPPKSWISTLSTTIDLIYTRAEQSAIHSIKLGRGNNKCRDFSPRHNCGALVELSNRRGAESTDYDYEDGLRAASIPTRLEKLSEKGKKQLINWGYLAAKSALIVDFAIEGKESLPYPEVDYRTHTGKCVEKSFPWHAGEVVSDSLAFTECHRTSEPSKDK
jgi:hypothetical protein